MIHNPVLAPLLLFTYKRLEPLKQTISALKKNYLAASTELYIYSDGSKSEKDAEQVNAVREYLKTVDGFKKVVVVNAAQNKGLAKSIITGVTIALEKYDRVIVLEDDLLTTPNFLDFMNSGLSCYNDNEKVFSISGYSFDLGEAQPDGKPLSEAYFLNRGWSWGWATWKDRWEKVDWSVADYNNFAMDKQAQQSFAKGGSDLNKMLQSQMTGQLDSWAIRWFFHQFKVSGLTLYPVHSKVYNNGFDQMATHTNGSDRRYRPRIDKQAKSSFVLPETAEINAFYYKKFRNKMGIVNRIISRVESSIIQLLRKK